MLGGVNNDASGLYYKLSKRDLKNTGELTGYYIHQDLFPLFMSWLCPVKFL
ncbi:MAG: hypothetical protein EOM50_23270 [Erysipelotrichia bacterium]|nr:hypothetical protein [Erysipelotrichia bacterium]